MLVPVAGIDVLHEVVEHRWSPLTGPQGTARARAISAGTAAVSTRLIMVVPYTKNDLKLLE
jgi:hypothetical protein